jgi:predicted dehydrogenase
MSQKPLEIGVVGCGYWGPNLIRNFNSQEGAHVRWVCDMDEKRLAHMKRLYPSVRTTQTYSDLIQDAELDAIAIATPVRFHYDLARQSLTAGKHTFIEKPMASSYAECRALNELAAQQKLILMVGHTFIYTAEVRKIKEILTGGELGDILYISSRRLNLGLFQKDINVAWDLAPHDISIILYLLDSLPVSVNCQGKPTLPMASRTSPTFHSTSPTADSRPS